MTDDPVLIGTVRKFFQIAGVELKIKKLALGFIYSIDKYIYRKIEKEMWHTLRIE